MVLQLLNPNDVKVYNVSSGKSIPEWKVVKKKTELKDDVEWNRRIELIQDFEFPTSPVKLKLSKDGQSIAATGVYKPQIRLFDLNQLSMKFDRHMDSENVQFHILSQDWTKMVFLQANRTLEFHTQGGLYYKTKLPRLGRDMAYSYTSCDLVVVGASSMAYRLNIDQGRFLNPVQSQASGINVCKMSAVHGLWGFGTEDGTIEFWDPRSQKLAGTLNVGLDALNSNSVSKSIAETTALKFSEDGLEIMSGTSSGVCLLYDLRSPRPLITKDHQYGYPIKDIKYHGFDKIISTDKKIMKIWNKSSGKLFTSIEPELDINDVCLYPNSGLIIMATEKPKIQTYYVPELGPAPRWCSFLDSITEELEESKQMVIYDDYKFVTRKDLEELGLDNLIGTNVLRAYMHGFFIDIRLYEKAKAIVNPFAYEEYRENLIRAKLEKERESRIVLQKNLPKINKKLAEKFMSTSTGTKEGASNPLNDQRFSEMFSNPEFEIDEESRDYKLSNPSKVNSQIREAFEEVKDQDIVFGTTEDGPDQQRRTTERSHLKTKKTAKQPKFYQIKDHRSINSIHQQISGEVPLGERVEKESQKREFAGTKTGSMEMSFQNSKRNNPRTQPNPKRRDRRGIHELGLKTPKTTGHYRRR